MRRGVERRKSEAADGGLTIHPLKRNEKEKRLQKFVTPFFFQMIFFTRTIGFIWFFLFCPRRCWGTVE